MEFFILGIQWLETGDEMDSINVPGIKEEENTAVDQAQEDSSQHANQGNGECREEHVNEEGDGKDFHEKVEGLYSKNSPKGGNLAAAKQTSVGQAKEVTLATKSEPHTAEPLEFKSNNQDKHSGAQMELLRESNPTEANKNSLGTEENQILDETSVSERNMDRTTAQGKLLGERITKDQHKSGTKDKVEHGLDNKCSQEVRTEVNLSRNGSSKPAEEAISKGTSSNTFEEVPRIQDKSMILNENKETIESKSENKDTGQAVNKSNAEEEETEQIEEKIIETIQEKKENLMALGIIKEAREKPKLDAGILQSASNEAVDIAVAELRTSPRFNFDLSMEERFEESYQSPLLHNKKIETQWGYQLSKPHKGSGSFSRRGKCRSGKKQFGLVKSSISDFLGNK